MKRLNTFYGRMFISFFIMALTCFAAKKPPEPDMSIVLEDGREVTLHPDQTWEFVKFSFIQDDMADIYMDLDDGRILCLKNDNTWSFVKKRPEKKRAAFKELPDINVTASATHGALDQAVKMARKKAFDDAAKRMYKYAKKTKMTMKYINACTIDLLGEEAATVSYKKAKGWNATAKLNISRVDVNKIIDCVLVQIEAGTGTEAEKK